MQRFWSNVALLAVIACCLLVGRGWAFPMLDSINWGATHSPDVFSTTLQGIGWYYTPTFTYDLYSISTSFAATTQGTNPRNITFQLQTDRPHNGGVVLAQGSFHADPTVGGILTATLNTPMYVEANVTYFINFLHVNGMSVNLGQWVVNTTNGLSIPAPGLVALGNPPAFYGNYGNDRTFASSTTGQGTFIQDPNGNTGYAMPIIAFFGSNSPEPSPSTSPSTSPSHSLSPTTSASPSRTASITPTIEPSLSHSPSTSQSPSITASTSRSPSHSRSSSITPSHSPSASRSASPSITASPSPSPSLHVLTIFPEPVTTYAECHIPPINGTAVAYANCSDIHLRGPHIVSNETNGCYWNRTVTVRWHAWDDCHERAEAYQYYSSIDNVPPVLDIYEHFVVVPIFSRVPPDLVIGGYNITDNCDPDPQIAIDNFPEPDYQNLIMYVKRLYTGYDACGNVSHSLFIYEYLIFLFNKIYYNRQHGSCPTAPAAGSCPWVDRGNGL